MQEEQPAAEQLDEQIHVAAEMARSRHMMGTPQPRESSSPAWILGVLMSCWVTVWVLSQARECVQLSSFPGGGGQVQLLSSRSGEPPSLLVSLDTNLSRYLDSLVFRCPWSIESQQKRLYQGTLY